MGLELDLDLNSSVKRFVSCSLALFPTETKEQILATAYTIAPGEEVEDVIVLSSRTVLRWRIERSSHLGVNQKAIRVHLGINACLFWSGDLQTFCATKLGETHEEYISIPRCFNSSKEEQNYSS